MDLTLFYITIVVSWLDIEIVATISGETPRKYCIFLAKGKNIKHELMALLLLLACLFFVCVFVYLFFLNL